MCSILKLRYLVQVNYLDSTDLTTTSLSVHFISFLFSFHTWFVVIHRRCTYSTMFTSDFKTMSIDSNKKKEKEWKKPSTWSILHSSSCLYYRYWLETLSKYIFDVAIQENLQTNFEQKLFFSKMNTLKYCLDWKFVLPFICMLSWNKQNVQ